MGLGRSPARTIQGSRQIIGTLPPFLFSQQSGTANMGSVPIKIRTSGFAMQSSASTTCLILAMTSAPWGKTSWWPSVLKNDRTPGYTEPFTSGAPTTGKRSTMSKSETAGCSVSSANGRQNSGTSRLKNGGSHIRGRHLNWLRRITISISQDRIRRRQT